MMKAGTQYLVKQDYKSKNPITTGFDLRGSGKVKRGVFTRHLKQLMAAASCLADGRASHRKCLFSGQHTL